jgi:hypothetical protein
MKSLGCSCVEGGRGQVDELACRYTEAHAWVTDAVNDVKYAFNGMRKDL